MDTEPFGADQIAAFSCPIGFDERRLRSKVIAQYERVALAPHDGSFHFRVGADHARRSGFPADRVEVVKTIIDPSLAPV
jgi:hypothetical protein